MRHNAMLAISLLLIIILAGVGCERKIINENAGEDQASLTSCFTCHGEDGLLLAAQGEWQNSVHASGNNVDYTNRGGGDDCTRCHDHQGFVDFLETGELNGPFENVSSIHCFTCHAPHTRGDLSLRTMTAFTLADGSTFDRGKGNLCANCHHSRASSGDIADDQDVHRYWGPHHGPQGDLLVAANGYEFTGEEYESTGHGSGDDKDGCVLCHMGNPETHLGYKLGGHSFNMLNEEDPEENLAGICQECHESADDYDYDDIQTDVLAMLDDLRTLLFDAGHLTDDDHPQGLPYGPGPHTIADEGEAGALWNFLIILEDRSKGVHNPKYIKKLLETSIDYMESRLPAQTTDFAFSVKPIAAH